jgi:hypothetical protein
MPLFALDPWWSDFYAIAGFYPGIRELPVVAWYDACLKEEPCASDYAAFRSSPTFPSMKRSR